MSYKTVSINTLFEAVEKRQDVEIVGAPADIYGPPRNERTGTMEKFVPEKTIKKEPMPDIEHPECYALDCDQPRAKSPRATATGGYMLVCERHSHDQSAKIKAGWNRKKERDAKGLPSKRSIKKPKEEQAKPPAVKILEDYDDTRKAHSLEPNLLEPDQPVSGGGNAMQLEREIIETVINEIIDDLPYGAVRKIGEAVTKKVLLHLLERIVG